MTVGTEMCSWVDAEDWRTNEGIKTEQAGYVGAQINTPRHAKDSQGTERPLRVLLLLFPQGKRRPRRRRGAKLNERKEPRRPAGAVRTLFSIEAYTVNDQESDNLWLTLIENY